MRGNFRKVELSVVAGEPHGEVIAVLFDFQMLRRPKQRLYLARESAFFRRGIAAPSFHCHAK